MIESKNNESSYSGGQSYTLRDQIEITGLLISQAEEDAAFYKRLWADIKDPFDAELINNIRLDKTKLLNYLENIYDFLTITELIKRDPKVKEISNLKQTFKTKMFDTLEDIDFLRKAHSAFKDSSIKDIFFEAIVDAQIHAQWLSYLYNKYS